jgi:V8-like Glu-specific endopeptidase
MDTPSHVRAKLCTIGLVLLPVLVGLDATAARSWAQEKVASCVDPSEMARSVVSIVRYFNAPRRNAAGEDIFGERATAWFYTSPRLLVTAAHFVRELSPRDWQEAELRQASQDGEPGTTVRVQLRVVAEGRPVNDHARGAERHTAPKEDVAILELREPFPNAQVLDVRLEPLAADATVLVLGYPGGRMQAAHGIIREARDRPAKFAGLTLLEGQGDNRLLLDGGTSGAPVLDCRQGQVIAVLNGLLTGPSLPFLPSGRSVVPTPWGSPTNTAVPAATLAAIKSRLP